MPYDGNDLKECLVSPFFFYKINNIKILGYL